MTISIDSEKAFEKIKLQFTKEKKKKTPFKVGIEGTYNKGHLQ